MYRKVWVYTLLIIRVGDDNSTQETKAIFVQWVDPGAKSPKLDKFFGLPSNYFGLICNFTAFLGDFFGPFAPESTRPLCIAFGNDMEK
jgi:hypothetical protein